MNKFLIVNADDFGFSSAVNEGVMEAVGVGIVSSVSMFANMPGFDDAVSRAFSQLNSCVGLHFNLTYGCPLSRPEHIPSLVNQEGEFRFRELDWKKPGWAAEDIKREFDAQFQRVESTGLTVSHIDSHHYIHNYKSVNDVVLSAAQKRGIPIRRLRDARQSQTCLTTDFLITEEYHGGDGLSVLSSALRSLQPGITELNCHPGRSDDVVKQWSTWTMERERELLVFTSPEARGLVRSADVELIRWPMVRQLLGRGSEQ